MTGGPSADRWRAFVASLRVVAPTIPENATAALDITRSGILDHPARTALRQAVALSRPDVVPDAIELARTLGELAALVGSHPVEPTRLTRGDYRTAHVRLAPLTPEHVPAMYAAALDPATSYRWRFHGRTPSPEEFHAALFASVMAQYAVVGTASGEILGVVTAYDESMEAGHCAVAFERVGSDAGGGSVIEGLALFVEYLFTTFPLRKVFAEVPAYNLAVIESIIHELGRIEGRRTDFYWYNGRLWDQVLVSVGRDAWETWVAAWVGADARTGAADAVDATDARRAEVAGDADDQSFGPTDAEAVAVAHR